MATRTKMITLSMILSTLCVSVVISQEQDCAIDLVLLVDNSGSVTTANNELQNLKDFLKNVVNEFTVGDGPSETQIGIVTFAGTATVRATIGESTAKVISAIDAIRDTQQYTNTLDAMKEALLMLELRVNRRNNADVVLMVTDGKPTVMADLTRIEDNDYSNSTKTRRNENQMQVIQKANEIRSRFNGKVITVGVTDAVDATFLQQVADSPENYFSVKDFASLSNKLADITNDTCTPAVRECNIDLALAVDMSGSVYNEVDKVKSFLLRLVNDLLVQQPHMHIALLRFRTQARTLVTLANSNTNRLHQAIKSLQSGGWTSTAQALRIVDQDIFNKQELQGDRGSNPNVLVILTDGLPTKMIDGTSVAENAAANERLAVDNEVKYWARRLKSKNVIIIPVIVEGKKGTDYSLLKQIADSPKTVVEVNNYTELLSMLKTIEQKICKAPEIASEERQLREKSLREDKEIEELAARLLDYLRKEDEN